VIGDPGVEQQDRWPVAIVDDEEAAAGDVHEPLHDRQDSGAARPLARRLSSRHLEHD